MTMARFVLRRPWVAVIGFLSFLAAAAEPMIFDSCLDAQGRTVTAVADREQAMLVRSDSEQGQPSIRYNPDVLPRLGSASRLFSMRTSVPASVSRWRWGKRCRDRPPGGLPWPWRAAWGQVAAAGRCAGPAGRTRVQRCRMGRAARAPAQLRPGQLPGERWRRSATAARQAAVGTADGLEQLHPCLWRPPLELPGAMRPRRLRQPPECLRSLQERLRR